MFIVGLRLPFVARLIFLVFVKILYVISSEYCEQTAIGDAQFVLYQIYSTAI